MTGVGMIGATMTLWTDGIVGVDLDRRPGPDDWLVLALGHSRLIPIRTQPAVIRGRLGIVVYADVPPSNRALALLTQLASGDTIALAAPEIEAENRRWVLEPRLWPFQAA